MLIEGNKFWNIVVISFIGRLSVEKPFNTNWNKVKILLSYTVFDFHTKKKYWDLTKESYLYLTRGGLLNWLPNVLGFLSKDTTSFVKEYCHKITKLKTHISPKLSTIILDLKNITSYFCECKNLCFWLNIVHVPLEFWKSVLVPWVCDKTSREKNKTNQNKE